AVVDRTAWPFRMPPVRAWHPLPPLAHIVEINGMIGRHKDERAGDKVFWLRRWRSRNGVLLNFFESWRLLGRRHVAGRFDEAAELGVRHVSRVDPKAVHAHSMSRPLGGRSVWRVRSHREFTAAYPNHAGWVRTNERDDAVGHGEGTRGHDRQE